MSLSAEHLDALLATGATAEQIVALVKIDLAERDKQLALKRDRDAERQRRHRESRDVTVTNAESQDAPAPLCPPKVSPAPPTNNPPLTPTPEASDEALRPEHVVEAWNDMAQPLGLSLVKKLTPERRRKLASRIKQNSIQEFTEAISAVPRSPFLRGENQRGWKADFDWMLEPRNFTKLTEGSYDR